jgi:hypothetical protein
VICDWLTDRSDITAAATSPDREQPPGLVSGLRLSKTDLKTFAARFQPILLFDFFAALATRLKRLTGQPPITNQRISMV